MIKIVNLTKSFGGHKVLDGINLTMPTGQITVVIGKSGVGKSVLLKHIIGLLKPDSGQIFVDGQDMSLLSGRQLQEFKRRFGVLFQGAALFDSMTVEERRNPELLNKSRIARIGRGSGKTQEQVRELIRQYRTMSKMFKQLKGLDEKKLQKGGLQGLFGKMKGMGKKKRLKLR